MLCRHCPTLAGVSWSMSVFTSSHFLTSAVWWLAVFAGALGSAAAFAAETMLVSLCAAAAWFAGGSALQALRTGGWSWLLASPCSTGSLSSVLRCFSVCRWLDGPF